jgi:hypothetical protein
MCLVAGKLTAFSAAAGIGWEVMSIALFPAGRHSYGTHRRPFTSTPQFV